MKLREALIAQSPSLTLQRAAADEIALLDAKLAGLHAMVEQIKAAVDTGRYDLSDRFIAQALRIYAP